MHQQQQCVITLYPVLHQVLDSLLEKSHCGYSPDWSLVETINELQMGKHLHTVHTCTLSQLNASPSISPSNPQVYEIYLLYTHFRSPSAAAHGRSLLTRLVAAISITHTDIRPRKHQHTHGYTPFRDKMGACQQTLYYELQLHLTLFDKHTHTHIDSLYVGLLQ